MCAFFAVSRSGYYAFVHRLDRPEKDAALAEVIAQQQERSFRTYGYRRMWLWLKSQNMFRNPKTVLRVMKKYGLLSEIRRRRKWQQMGQQVHRYENLLNREFHADRPNRKWVTDISYIHTKQGVLYLSMIRDLYDNSIVAYKTGTQQTVNLVLDTIRLAMKQQEKAVAAELQLHSDQGFQYTSRAYFNLTQAYGITPSMSRKGNPYDNARDYPKFCVTAKSGANRVKFIMGGRRVIGCRLVYNITPVGRDVKTKSFISPLPSI